MLLGGCASSHKIRCNGRDVAEQRLAAHDFARTWVGASLFERSPAQPCRCPHATRSQLARAVACCWAMRCDAANGAGEARVGLVTSPHVPARLVARSFAALDRGIRFSLARADAIECGRSAAARRRPPSARASAGTTTGMSRPPVFNEASLMRQGTQRRCCEPAPAQAGATQLSPVWNGAWNRLMSLSLFTKTVAERTALSVSQLQQPNQ